jgi:outer membrane biogenesis lipoprotein LolB
MKSKIFLSLFALSMILMLSACGSAQRREMRARERERKHQESKDQLDRDKKNFNKTFDNPGNED